MNKAELEAGAALLKESMRTIEGWPKPGVSFKDIQSILLDPELTALTLRCLVAILPRDADDEFTFDAIVAFDSRGFIFGPQLALIAGVPFVMARKKGKLPGKTIRQEYQTEYSLDTIEIQEEAIKPGQRVLVHDDLLATGGTSGAAALIVPKFDATVVCFHYLMELEFLPGRKNLLKHVPDDKIVSLIKY